MEADSLISFNSIRIINFQIIYHSRWFSCSLFPTTSGLRLTFQFFTCSLSFHYLCLSWRRNYCWLSFLLLLWNLFLLLRFIILLLIACFTVQGSLLEHFLLFHILIIISFLCVLIKLFPHFSNYFCNFRLSRIRVFTFHLLVHFRSKHEKRSGGSLSNACTCHSKTMNVLPFFSFFRYFIFINISY